MLTLAFLALACTVQPSDKPGVDTAVVQDPDADADRDGYTTAQGDCDDSDDTRFPGAVEACDGLDQDCDGEIDDGVGATFYADVDEDGYGDPEAPRQACEQPQDAVATATDCDDTDGAVFPGAPEVCDGRDNDCDGTADDGVDVGYWMDADTDGFGDDANPMRGCEVPADAALVGGDCDDALSDVYPDAPEVCDGVDQDCDGDVDEDLTESYWADLDADGWGDATLTVDACSVPDGYAAQADDCDDTLADVYPGAPEVCDGLDNDCDGAVDGSGSVDATTWHIDYDGDGFGGTRYTVVSCDAPAGYVADATDCDDGTDTTYPGATESCDGVDNDCNGSVDDGGSVSWYADVDGDGFGDPSALDTGCEVPADAALEAGDCDDADADAYPGADEACDGADNDCDGAIDEEVTSTFWADLDGDGWGDPALEVDDCAAPAGYVARADDCDDGAPTTNPSAAELCDGADNDCDGTVDESGASDARDWYADADGDGYGLSTSVTTSCAAPSGSAATSGDCDDGEETTYPGAPEVCDDVDNDCDGTADESAVDAPTWYIDYDADGYGGSRFSVVQCDAPTGYVAGSTDCDDTSASRFPGGTEVCDGADDDCDGLVDEPDAVDAAVWYADVDGDGWGDTSDTTIACDAPAGSVALDGDCAVTDRTAYPGAPEYCDGSDDDCDGSIDEDAVDAGLYYADGDGDGYGGSSVSLEACTAPSGYVASASDCADAYASRYPGAPETCNDADDDCDGTIDDGLTFSSWYTDADGDGWGRPTGSVVDCEAPSGTVADAGDCDDTDGDVSPDASETCNDVDDDCDGSIDEGLSTSVWYTDADGDGYGTTASAMSDCAAPSGRVAVGGDCNDSAGTVSPAATETCNGVDDDCDGTVDDGVLGTGSACPAEDCAEILSANPSASSGNYVLDIGTYYCDMSTDGGGWTRVANNLAVWGSGYDTTYYNSERFTWDEALFRYDSGSVTAHCTYPGSLTGCNNLGFQFSSENWGVPLNWGSSICGMSITDYTSATSYVGGYDFKVGRSSSTATIRLGTLEGISYCTPGDNPGTAYVDVYVRR